ncbi:MAG TPA: hypothetical protein VET23_03165 [Chitinophagaceae bacterium]|nr:hypothetical protein [Chitinophagaceae bacterium]
MSDNLKKKKMDAKRISQQPWEKAYQRRKSRLKSQTAKVKREQLNVKKK